LPKCHPSPYPSSSAALFGTSVRPRTSPFLSENIIREVSLAGIREGHDHAEVPRTSSGTEVLCPALRLVPPRYVYRRNVTLDKFNDVGVVSNHNTIVGRIT